MDKNGQRVACKNWNVYSPQRQNNLIFFWLPYSGLGKAVAGIYPGSAMQWDALAFLPHPTDITDIADIAPSPDHSPLFASIRWPGQAGLTSAGSVAAGSDGCLLGRIHFPQFIFFLSIHTRIQSNGFSNSSLHVRGTLFLCATAVEEVCGRACTQLRGNSGGCATSWWAHHELQARTEWGVGERTVDGFPAGTTRLTGSGRSFLEPTTQRPDPLPPSIGRGCVRHPASASESEKGEGFWALRWNLPILLHQMLPRTWSRQQ